METKVTLGECLGFGWITFTKNPLLYVVAIGVVDVLSYIPDYLPEGPYPWDLVLHFIIGLAAGVLFVIVMINFMLAAHDSPDTVSYRDIFRPRHFLKLAGTWVLSVLIVLIGLILVLVPGLIFLSMFSLAGYLAVDQGLRPIAALKRSKLITKGSRFTVLYLFLISLLGGLSYAVTFSLGELPSALISIVVDIIVLPTTGIGLAHAYRVLDRAVPEAVPASAS
jgi:hypothetical protein